MDEFCKSLDDPKPPLERPRQPSVDDQTVDGLDDETLMAVASELEPSRKRPSERRMRGRSVRLACPPRVSRRLQESEASEQEVYATPTFEGPYAPRRGKLGHSRQSSVDSSFSDTSSSVWSPKSSMSEGIEWVTGSMMLAFSETVRSQRLSSSASTARETSGGGGG